MTLASRGVSAPAKAAGCRGVEREIQIEVRPEQSWSLTVWRAVVDDGSVWLFRVEPRAT